MYNILHGRNQYASVILAMLGLDESDFGRFRDAHVAEGEIAVYTRCGGGNRDDYGDTFKSLREHPNYLRDEDDDFDSTYATIYFSIPAEFKEVAGQLETGKWEPDALWASKLESLKGQTAETLRQKYPELVKVLDQITDCPACGSGQVYVRKDKTIVCMRCGERTPPKGG